MVQGQVNLLDAVGRTIEHRNPDGRVYRLNETVATLLVRPRGWHLPERHFRWTASRRRAASSTSGSTSSTTAGGCSSGERAVLLPPEAREPPRGAALERRVRPRRDPLGLPKGAIRATVLVETIPAAFEMDEILWELRDHSGGLNAGRWDYMFSLIKKFRPSPRSSCPTARR
jgi:malate synthase